MLKTFAMRWIKMKTERYTIICSWWWNPERIEWKNFSFGLSFGDFSTEIAIEDEKAMIFLVY